MRVGIFTANAFGKIHDTRPRPVALCTTRLPRR